MTAPPPGPPPGTSPYPVDPPPDPRRVAPYIDVRRLWAGGVATALVAALVAILGILLTRALFKIPVLAPTASGTWGDASTTTYALLSFLFGLLATGLMHVLLLTTAAPFSFFGWIIGLVTLVGVVLPFTVGTVLSAEIATALINLVIGAAVGSLVSTNTRRCIGRRPVA